MIGESLLSRGNGTLPIAVMPFQDELFGSWLFRLSMHNALQSTDRLQAYLGVSKSIKRSNICDILNSSQNTLFFLTQLGITYPEYINNFSTFPYWICFEEQERNDITRDISEPSHSAAEHNGYKLLAMSRISHLSRYMLQYCPACVYQDTSKFGEPYLHRSHQLPATRYCHLHGTELISRCPKCNSALIVANELSTPSVNCKCGFYFGRPQQTSLKNMAWVRLAKFESAALHSGTKRFGIHGLADYIRYRLAIEFPGRKGASALRGLKEIYGPEGANWLLQGLYGYEFTRKNIYNLPFRSLKPKHYCALLAGLDYDYDTSLTRFHDFIKNSKSPTLKPSIYTKVRASSPKSILDAREQLLLYTTDHPKAGRKIIRYLRPKLFWYLILYDLDWISTHLPHMNNFPLRIPTVQEDRETIGERPKIALSGTGLGRHAHECAIRASYRDQDWLKTKLENQTTKDKQDQLIALTKCLNTMHADLMSNASKPKRITMSLTAKYLGVSLKSLRRYRDSSKEIRKLTHENLNDYHTRALRWALDYILSNAKNPTPSLLIKTAGLTYSSKNIAICNEITMPKNNELSNKNRNI